MLFSSSIFLFAFLPIVFILNIILPARSRNFFLLAASLVFYAWGEPFFILLMLFSITINYCLAILISNASSFRSKQSFLVVAVVLNLVLLGVFKYANFITLNLTRLTGFDLAPASIPLPIGISFFTFQALSYIIDVYKGSSAAEGNILNVALYISFFPQLIAGPIIKHHDIAEQIRARSIDAGKISSGIARFITGLSKKLLIANILGESADIIFSSSPSQIGSLSAWAGALAYTLQIYFDFSGYSDMAIGLGRMFGFEFKENFNYPYVSSSMNEFWKRWHISLTNWFREYLYIPLGGNRNGTVRTYMNLLTVFLCTGFWHGAEWTFVVWGLSHGAFMMLERSGIIKPESQKNRLAGKIYTLFVVTVTFTIFRAPDLSFALRYLRTMFSFSAAGEAMLLVTPEIYSALNISVFIIAVAASLPVIRILRTSMRARTYDILKYAFSLILLVLCSFSLAGESFNPFIYFRF